MQIEEALAAGRRSILLDNFDARQARGGEADARWRAPVVLEASGGITLGPHPRDQQDRRRRRVNRRDTHLARAIDFSCQVRPVDSARKRD